MKRQEAKEEVKATNNSHTTLKENNETEPALQLL
jgi:hypothetical protein